MNIQTNIPKKVFVKIYYNSKKKHSIYIMKVLIIILILLICFIIIKSNYESFEGLGGTTTVDYNYIEELLDKNGLLDKTIINKLDEYKKLKDTLENKQITEIKEDIGELKRRYNNTKIQLENILFNKFRPNRLDFNNKQQDFKLKLNSFIGDLKGEKIKITNYGSIDTEQCGNKWKLPDNVPPINNKDIKGINDNIIKPKYFNPNTNCCTSENKDSCIYQYKQNVKLYNEYKVVLKNQNNKQLELNKIKDNIYLVNLNSQIINYDKNNNYDIIHIFLELEDVISNNNKKSACFKIIEIKDLIHLNQFITKDPVEDKLIEYPLYLIIPYERDKIAITIHGKTNIDGEKLSIQPLSKEMINHQIFYKN